MPKRILIVDDEEDMRVFLETLFGKAGYEVSYAANGDDALAVLGGKLPDLITLDILMPKKSGLSFFETIKDDPAFQNIPVIILSGVTRHAELFDESSRSAPVVFFEKPVNHALLLERARELLGD